MGRVANEKYATTMELVGHPLIGLPRRDIHHVDVDRLTNRLRQQLAATLHGELCGGFPVAREVCGDEHAEVLMHRQEYALHFGVLDLDGVSIAKVRHISPPGTPEVNENGIDRQWPVTGRCHAKCVADRAMHTVSGDDVVDAHCFQRIRVSFLQNDLHSSFVLLQRAQLGTVAHQAAALTGVGEQNWFESALRAVLRGRFGAHLLEGREHRVGVERLFFFGAVQRRLGEHVRNALSGRVDPVGEA